MRVFGALGQEIGARRIGGLEDSHGRGVRLAARPALDLGEEPGPDPHLPGGGEAAGAAAGDDRRRTRDRGRPTSNPNGSRSPRPPAALYAIDAADDQVVCARTRRANYRGRLEAAESPAGSFDFGSERQRHRRRHRPGPGFGDVYVLSGKGDGTVWAFSPTGKFLWELKPESGDEFASLDGRRQGQPLDRRTERRHLRIRRRRALARLPERTGGKIDAGNSVAALAFAGSGHLFVARELDGTLTTLGNVISQIATELGFLLVPMALASMHGAKGLRRDPRTARLPRLQAARPSAGWRSTFVLYLAFTIFYSVVITEPKQKDIAESFGPTSLQILLIVIAAPIAEETCFRGMLFGGLREKLPRLAAALICGLIFGALHALDRDHRGAAADRLRLPPGAALRADRLDRARDPPAHAQQHDRVAGPVSGSPVG